MEGDWAVLEVEGEVDLYTAPSLREAIIKRIEAGDHQVLVDLARVSFMDSSGLGVLVGCLKRLRESGGDLSLVCPEGPVLKVMLITGLDKVFAIHASISNALPSPS